MYGMMTWVVVVGIICSSTAFLNYPSRPSRRLPLSMRSKERSEDSVFKAGSHTYASWKQPEAELEEAVEDIDVDDRVVEREPSNLLLDWIRRLYNAIFFYGLDTPTRSKRMRPLKSLKRKRKSMFFTPGEQFSQELFTDPDSFVVEDRVEDRAADVRDIEAEIARNLERMSVLDVSLELQRQEEGGVGSDYYKTLERRKERLVEANERLQVELVNRLAAEE